MGQRRGIIWAQADLADSYFTVLSGGAMIKHDWLSILLLKGQPNMSSIVFLKI